MRYAFLWKFLSTAFVAALLLVPLAMISAKINERQMRRDAVARELADTGVGSQRIAGPILVVPCVERYSEEVTDTAGRKSLQARTLDCTQRFTPNEVKVNAPLATETRKRGIYEVLFYRAALDMRGSFDVRVNAQPAKEGGVREFGLAQLRLGVQDVRGIQGAVKLTWDQRALAFAPGSNDQTLGAGMHAQLPVSGPALNGARSFTLSFGLNGTRELSFVPLARETQVSLEGHWPHPSFYGRFLPEKPSVSDKGFNATWRISELASGAAQALMTCSQAHCASLNQEVFGVALIEPVDVYLQSSRAVNYGFLFVGLTFTTFLLFEVMKALRVHPVQYGLVGLGLAVFFLLLFSLAEHLAFMRAYLIAASACIALIAFYVSHILHSVKRGVLFSFYMIGLYTALYLLLRSEDYAMLLGALLVFGVLALVMVLTRKMDWYQIGARLEAMRSPPAMAEQGQKGSV